MHFTKVALALAFAMTLGGAEAMAQSNNISVVVTGLRNNNGDVRCGLYNSDATFPKDGKQFQGAVAPIANMTATCTFSNVPPGTYAVAVFHAEKGETKLRTGFFGQPEEGYGFSRNAKGSMGPPSFSAAAYAYPGGNVNFPITIIYP